jgi:hypothetical protein
LGKQERLAEKVVLVMHNPNTHRQASLYEALPPEQACRIAGHVEWHDTSKLDPGHSASWKQQRSQNQETQTIAVC